MNKYLEWKYSNNFSRLKNLTKKSKVVVESKNPFKIIFGLISKQPSFYDAFKTIRITTAKNQFLFQSWNYFPANFCFYQKFITYTPSTQPPPEISYI